MQGAMRPAPVNQSVIGAVSISFLVHLGMSHWHWLAVGRLTCSMWFGSGWKNWQNSWISDVHSLVIYSDQVL